MVPTAEKRHHFAIDKKTLLGSAAAAVVMVLLLSNGRPTLKWADDLFWFWVGITALSDGVQDRDWWTILYGEGILLYGFEWSNSFAKGENHVIFTFTFFVLAIVEAGAAYWIRRQWQEETARFESILSRG